MSERAACAKAPRGAAPSTPGRGTLARPSASRRAGLLATAFVFTAVCALAAAACGGSGAGQSLSSEPTPTPTQRHDQQASSLHLSAADCAVLAHGVANAVGAAPRRRSEPTPPLSRCQITGKDLNVNVYLDVGHAARQRYENRITEQVQFGAPDRSKLPRPVPNVGDPGAYDHFASWVPALDTLFAVRGNRWLTVAYSRAGVPTPRLLAEAAALAPLAFRLSSS